MSDQPWPKHRFMENARRPDWCIKCGRNKSHANHSHQTAWVRKMAKMLKKPRWKVFN